MEYLPISFLAGILTIFAPCVFTLLPVILGGSLTGNNWKKPVVIISSLSASIFVFTLILKASTLLIEVDPDFWKYLSGFLIIIYGVFLVFPEIWARISAFMKLPEKSNELLRQGSEKKSFWGDVLIGVSLGPVFSSCSPTYAIIIATILPKTPLIGLVNLLAYVTGLALILAMISLFSLSLTQKLKWAVDPKGWFKKALGIILIIVGLVIVLGLDKSFETLLLDRGIFGPSNIELDLLKRID